MGMVNIIRCRMEDSVLLKANSGTFDPVSKVTVIMLKTLDYNVGLL